jgi:UDP-sulfoquinovose synthase
MEEHYNPAHHELLELGLKPHLMTDNVLAVMIEKIIPYRERIVASRIPPRVRWR